MAYDAAFLLAVQRTLVEEGVLSDRASDRGGITKYGVTIPFLTDYLGKPATAADIIALTKDKAIDAYYVVIWKKRGLASLPGKIAGEVFDFAVNSGPGQAIKTLQKVLKINPDGVLGPLVVQACGMCVARRLCNDYLIARGRFLMDLCQHDASQLDSLEGWYNRVVERLDFGYA